MKRKGLGPESESEFDCRDEPGKQQKAYFGSENCLSPLKAKELLGSKEEKREKSTSDLKIFFFFIKKRNPPYPLCAHRKGLLFLFVW